jgi:uncharacterized membrane protein
MIPIRTHAFLDYAVGAALVLLPALLLPPEAITARWAMMLAGVVALVYSAATDYDWSLVRWIPFRTHLKLDAGLGLGRSVDPGFRRCRSLAACGGGRARPDGHGAYRLARSGEMTDAPRAPSFPTAAGLFLGLGLGGFFDGIVLHQVLQWHHMASHAVPPDSLEALRFNVFLDGLFHALTYVFVAAGLALLWRAGHRRHLKWSTGAFAGTLLMGFGPFNAAPRGGASLSLEGLCPGGAGAQKPRPSYFFLNFETRPPVSMRRDEPPVQAGCTVGSMSSASVSPSLPHVERILNTVPSVILTSMKW